jgi:hypothetical protein
METNDSHSRFSHYLSASLKKVTHLSSLKNSLFVSGVTLNKYKPFKHTGAVCLEKCNTAAYSIEFCDGKKHDCCRRKSRQQTSLT